MNISSAFPGQYLKADDIGQHRPVVVIDRVEMEEIGGEHKPILFFQGKDRGLVLNKTNASMISELLGTSETDDWTGQRIRLYQTKVDFQGKRVPAIRVEAAPVNGQPEKAKPAPLPSVAAFQADDEDVPF